MKLLTILALVGYVVLAACNGTQAAEVPPTVGPTATMSPTRTPLEVAVDAWARLEEVEPDLAAKIEAQKAEAERLNDPEKLWDITIAWADGTTDRYLAQGPVLLVNDRTLLWRQVDGGVRIKYIYEGETDLRYIDIGEH